MREYLILMSVTCPLPSSMPVLLKRNNTSYIRPLTSYIVSWSLIRSAKALRFNNSGPAPLFGETLKTKNMEVIKTAIEGVVIIEPRIFEDSRGYFFESFSQREFEEKVMPINFVQDNESKSSYGVMRGLHFQRPPFTQSKLVRCVKGAVLDVAVDIRKGSLTYGQHVAVELTEDNHRQFFIPKGFAHGFAVLSETAVFQYKCDEFYHPEADGGISILDDSLGIDWRIKDKAILSDKDTKHPLLKDFDSPFDITVDLYK